MESRVGRLTTSATPDSAHEAHHHHDHEIEGPAITPKGCGTMPHRMPPPDVPDVHINGVTKRFGDVVAVDNMDLVRRPRLVLLASSAHPAAARRRPCA